LARIQNSGGTLSAKTYQEQLLDAGLPRAGAFEVETIDRAERDSVRAYILYLKSQPVSYLFLPVEGDRVVYAYLGYDPKCADHSPGTVLQLLVMERLFAEPNLRVFDFTEGDGQHKRLFGTSVQQCEDVLLVRPMAVTEIVARAHAAFERAQSPFISVLDRIGLKDRFKRMLRAARFKKKASPTG
jgi:CelD/BcsL family acetyltransferase involved in cellulose biosynthesis